MEYIEFSLRAKGKNVSREVIEKLNEKFALPLNRYASRYSLGMKKRLMLLTLMLQDNDIVIMDEPHTSFLQYLIYAMRLRIFTKAKSWLISQVCQQSLLSIIFLKNSFHLCP